MIDAPYLSTLQRLDLAILGSQDRAHRAKTDEQAMFRDWRVRVGKHSKRVEVQCWHWSVGLLDQNGIGAGSWNAT